MPKRTTYKKSKKQRKSNNKTRYRKSKSHSKRIKAGGLAEYSKPSYECKDNNLYQKLEHIMQDNKNISQYFDHDTGKLYKCENNTLYENQTPVTNKRFKCTGNDIMYNSMLMADSYNKPILAFRDGDTTYTCSNNKLLKNGKESVDNNSYNNNSYSSTRPYYRRSRYI